MINWIVVGQLSRQYLRAPTLDHCSLSHRSSSSVCSTISSRGGQLAIQLILVGLGLDTIGQRRLLRAPKARAVSKAKLYSRRWCTAEILHTKPLERNQRQVTRASLLRESGMSICYALQRAGSHACTRRIGANSNFTSREISFTWTNWLAYLAGSVRGDLAYPREGNLQLVVEEVSVSARILVHHRKAVGGQFSKPSDLRKKRTHKK